MRARGSLGGDGINLRASISGEAGSDGRGKGRRERAMAEAALTLAEIGELSTPLSLAVADTVEQSNCSRLSTKRMRTIRKQCCRLESCRLSLCTFLQSMQVVGGLSKRWKQWSLEDLTTWFVFHKLSSNSVADFLTTGQSTARIVVTDGAQPFGIAVTRPEPTARFDRRRFAKSQSLLRHYLVIKGDGVSRFVQVTSSPD